MQSQTHLSSLIETCNSLKNLKQIHARIIINQTLLDHSKLVSLYNALLRALSQNKHPIEALPLYRNLLRHGLKPNHMTFPFAIKASADSSETTFGISIHTHVVKLGFGFDSYVQSSLIRLYSNGKYLNSAKRIFDICREEDVVCSNCMIDCYVKAGEIDLARKVFDEMPLKDVVSWNTMINGYAIFSNIKQASNLFDEMPQRNIISWNSMLSGFAKVGNIENALDLFRKMPRKDIVSWNTMLSCYAQSGKSNETLALFDEMKRKNPTLIPTESTFVALLSACTHLGALDQGSHLHSQILDLKIKINSIVATALIEMYAKCGNISKASEIFNSMKSKDVLAWNTIINGMAIHGHADEARNLFYQMIGEGLKPNDITFVAMLGAFRHAGMVDEGKKMLDCMGRNFGVEPKVEHYGCVVDLLARAGRLEEALDLIGSMPVEANACAWGALLGGCRIYRNDEVGETVGRRLLDLQPQHSGRYILLSNIYAAAKRWDDARNVRNLMKSKGISKVPGVSVIEFKGTIHRFVAGDSSHPESDHIYRKLTEISERLKTTIGYSPDTDQVLVDVEEEEKENAVSVHSEKLAIAYGFMKLGPFDGAVRIVKNLRVCGDCHDFAKLISRVYGREIIVRDRNRFHHFKQEEATKRTTPTKKTILEKTTALGNITP